MRVEVLWIRVLRGGGVLRSEEGRGVVGSAMGDRACERVRGVVVRVWGIEGSGEAREIRGTRSVVVLICHCWGANVSILSLTASGSPTLATKKQCEELGNASPLERLFLVNKCFGCF